MMLEDGSLKEFDAVILIMLRDEQVREIWLRLAESLTVAEQEALVEWREKEQAAG